MNANDRHGLVAIALLGLLTPAAADEQKRRSMMLQIVDGASDFEGARTPNGSAPKDLLQVLASTTACSSTVFYGLLAWASLNAHLPSKAEITTVVGRQGTGPHS